MFPPRDAARRTTIATQTREPLGPSCTLGGSRTFSSRLMPKHDSHFTQELSAQPHRINCTPFHLLQHPLVPTSAENTEIAEACRDTGWLHKNPKILGSLAQRAMSAKVGPRAKIGASRWDCFLSSKPASLAVRPTALASGASCIRNWLRWWPSSCGCSERRKGTSERGALFVR